MLEKISLIASIISGITAITSSLRAVGASREFSRNEAVSKVKTSCRVGASSPSLTVSQRSNLKLHIFVTAVWYFLSVIFALPYYSLHWTGEIDAGILLLASPFIILAVIILVIWMIVRSKI
jgi:hypothetical protein